jgi:DNA-binding NarL/FixJ family response regulator
MAEKRLALKTHRIRFYMQWMREKSEAMKDIEGELKLLKTRLPDEQVEKFSKVLQLNIHTDDDWEFFKKAFEEVYPRFFGALRYSYPELTPAELRLSALIKLKLSIKESAAVLGISLDSVKTARYRLRKKLMLHEEENLEEFIARVSTGEVTKI